MAIALWSLASGSSGNCIWLEADGGALLLDAGLSASAVLSKLSRLERNPSLLRAVLITHEHTDHVLGAVPIARKLRVPIISTSATLGAILSRGASADVEPHPCGATFEVAGLEVTSFRTEHDALDPVGYALAAGKTRICLTTDTGTLTPAIRRAMSKCSLVVLESNHDVQRLVSGPYPAPLKARILGDTGHLSNDAAAAAVASLSEEGKPTCVWLAHLSEVNNTPALAMRCAHAALRHARPENVRVSVALRDHTSLYWSSQLNWWQRSLF